jgi:hypothetical protein
LAGKTLRPYILGGGGISVDTVNAKIVQYNSSTSTTTPVSDSSTSTLNPMVELGVGFEFPLFANAGLFFEGKYQLVLSQGGSGFLVPIDGGLSVLF